MDRVTKVLLSQKDKQALLSQAANAAFAKLEQGGHSPRDAKANQ